MKEFTDEALSVSLASAEYRRLMDEAMDLGLANVAEYWAFRICHELTLSKYSKDFQDFNESLTGQ